MATVQLFSLFLLFLIFVVHPTRVSSICPTSNCSYGPPVRFPFRLQNLQPSRCGYNPWFDLSCSNQTLITTLTLPAATDNFIVQLIDYEFQTLYINDPNRCLPKRFLDNVFKFHGAPFHIESFKNITFLNCSSQARASQATSLPVMATNISCLSTENHTVFAVPSRAYEEWLRSTSSSSTSLSPSPSPSPSPSEALCPVISSVSVPSTAANEMLDMFGDVRSGVGLTWSTPDCRDCEARGGDCGFNRDADRVVCSNIPEAKREALPRSAKYGIIVGVGIPGLLCIIGLASYVFGRIKACGRRHQPSVDLSTLASQQPAFVTVGLDGPTIQSYPKTFLGESKRLPKPNDNTCSICLSEYETKEALRTIPECNHYFHASCIDEWLKMNPTCPVCRNSPEGSSLATPSSSVSSSTFSLASP